MRVTIKVTVINRKHTGYLNKRIILHCASGGRSALAAQTLRQMGYETVAHLDGGIKAWKEAGLPVEGQ